MAMGRRKREEQQPLWVSTQAISRPAMRRTHLRGQANILKCLLVHVSGFNLSLVLRRVLGVGTARGMQGCARRIAAALALLTTLLSAMARPAASFMARSRPADPGPTHSPPRYDGHADRGFNHGLLAGQFEENGSARCEEHRALLLLRTAERRRYRAL